LQNGIHRHPFVFPLQPGQILFFSGRIYVVLTGGFFGCPQLPQISPVVFLKASNSVKASTFMAIKK
jgi:hypothetical protein